MQHYKLLSVTAEESIFPGLNENEKLISGGAPTSRIGDMITSCDATIETSNSIPTFIKTQPLTGAILRILMWWFSLVYCKNVNTHETTLMYE